MICYIVFDVMSCFGHDIARSVILSTRLGFIRTSIMMVVLSLMHSVLYFPGISLDYDSWLLYC